MGDFSYAQSEELGYTDFNSGYADYATTPGFDPGLGYEQAGAEAPAEFGYATYQDEVQALIPQDMPLLGAILLEQGVLDQPALQAAMAKQAETGDSLAQVLLDENLAAPDQLVAALQIRASYG